MKNSRQLHAIIKVMKFQSSKNGSNFMCEKVPFRKSSHILYISNLLSCMFTTHPYSKDTKDNNATHYRDSFIEAMNEIKD